MLITVYGLGLIGAGFFSADQAFGFPPGTPAGRPTSISFHGLMHFVSGGVGFIALIAACFLLARRFAVQGERRWALYSLGTGVVFFAAFAGIASGSGQVWITLAFEIAMVLAWAWISVIMGRSLAELRKAEP